MSMSSESDEMMMSINGVDSPPMDDANSGGNVGANGQLKKGPWTSAEDAILVEYVTKNGEGNWNAVQKHSGLARCGKSCRLRWANHLRPDLKKGAFSPDEERRIIELHAKMGNKWARMAAELPGRTDNEIKNYWNTRIKRRQRAGLPIYPPDICLQALNENQQTHDNMNNHTFPSADMNNMNHQGFIQVNNYEVPEFKNFELNQQLYPPPLLDIPAPNMLDIPASSLLAQGFQTPNHRSYPSKRLRGPESFFPGLTLNPAAIGTYQNYGSVPAPQSFVFSSTYDHNNNNNNSLLSSDPAWAMKLELPSLQTQMGRNNWGPPSPSSPGPSLDSVDTLIQTPPTESCNLSPQNSGLLDAVLYESQTMKNSSNGNNSNGRQHMMMDNSNSYLHETEWEAYGEQLSPLGHSPSSVFSESTPNSLDEPHSAETLPGYKVKEELNNLGPMQYDEKTESRNQMIFTRPDFLLGSNCFGPMKDATKDHSLLKDAIGTLLGDDLNRDCKQMDTGATSSAQGSHSHDSCTWNPMSTV